MVGLTKQHASEVCQRFSKNFEQELDKVIWIRLSKEFSEDEFVHKHDVAARYLMVPFQFISSLHQYLACIDLELHVYITSEKFNRERSRRR